MREFVHWQLSLPDRMVKHFLFLTALLLATCTGVNARDFTAPPGTIKGTVTASDKSPLQGVSVMVDGTSSGTVTDAKGNYFLTIPTAAMESG